MTLELLQEYNANKPFIRQMRELKQQLAEAEEKIREGKEDYGVTLKLLEEYNANKPFLVQIQKLKHQLIDTEEELQKCKLHLENEEFWDELGEMFKWSISEDELYKASMELGLGGSSIVDRKPSLSPANLKDMVMDVFYHPSRYVEVIREMMDIYNL
jgi:hypothetical protein